MADTLTDLELHFKAGDPLFLSMDDSTDTMRVRPDDGALIYTITTEGAEEEITVDPTQLVWMRRTTRPKDQQPDQQPDASL